MLYQNTYRRYIEHNIKAEYCARALKTPLDKSYYTNIPPAKFNTNLIVDRPGPLPSFFGS